MSSEASKKAGEAGNMQRNLAGEVGAMPTDSYLSQLRKALEMERMNARANLTDTLYGSEAIAGQDRENQLRAAQATLDLYPSIARKERRQTANQRRDDVRDIGQYGGDLAGILGQLSGSYGALDQAAQDGQDPSMLLRALNARSMMGSPLTQMLQGQAADELAQGRNLTDEENRMATQAAREAFGSRGILNSNPALIQEAMNRVNLGNQRLDQRRQFAAQADELGRREVSLAQGTEGLNQNQQGRSFQQLLQAQDARLRPILGLLSQRTATSPLAAAQLMSLGTTTGQAAQTYWGGPSLNSASNALGPLTGWTQDAYNTNFNARQAAILNEANGQAATGAGLMKFGSSLAGAGAGMGGGGGGAMGGGGYGAGFSTSAGGTPNAGTVPGYGYTSAGGYYQKSY